MSAKKERAGPRLRQIREIAMDMALAYEKAHNREPRNVSNQRGLGYDILSGDQKIEVKGQEWKWKKLRSSFLYLTENEPRNATHLYVVCDVFGSPDLHVFEFSRIPFHALKVEVKFALRMARCRDYEEKECAREPAKAA